MHSKRKRYRNHSYKSKKNRLSRRRNKMSGGGKEKKAVNAEKCKPWEYKMYRGCLSIIEGINVGKKKLDEELEKKKETWTQWSSRWFSGYNWELPKDTVFAFKNLRIAQKEGNKYLKVLTKEAAAKKTLEMPSDKELKNIKLLTKALDSSFVPLLQIKVGDETKQERKKATGYYFIDKVKFD
jgi:hypothetical protein